MRKVRQEIKKENSRIQVNSVNFWYNHPQECRIENEIARINSLRRRAMIAKKEKGNIYIGN